MAGNLCESTSQNHMYCLLMNHQLYSGIANTAVDCWRCYLVEALPSWYTKAKYNVQPY